MAQHERGGFERRQGFAARFAAQPADSRRGGWVDHQAMQLQEPRVAPPQRLCLFPAAVEQNDAVEAAQDPRRIGYRLAVAAEDEDLAPFSERRRTRRSEIEN